MAKDIKTRKLGTSIDGARPNVKVSEITHPEHLALSQLWLKWRLTYEGGEPFKLRYLRPFSSREDFNSFYYRRMMSYVPAFAKTGINEIRNSISHRLGDVIRQSSSKTYQEAVEGLKGGVDRKGGTMNYFLTTEVLPELLVMSKVGIYVDMDRTPAANLQESYTKRPYLYIYKAEQIRSWTADADNHGVLNTLLLEDSNYDFDDHFLLPIETVKRYRYYWREDNKCYCQIYDTGSQPVGDVIELGIGQIPFHLTYLSSSMMEDICDYQIALLNMASSDVQFARQANFPMYVEKYDVAADMTANLRQATSGDLFPQDHPYAVPRDGTSEGADRSHAMYKEAGIMNGRRFPQGIDYPEWIQPSGESLTSSMAKQEQMKEEIRTLLYLGLANLQPTRQSAESKGMDIKQEENGFNVIGHELLLLERKILEFWQAYENIKDPFTIKYPTNYDLKTTQERIDEATAYALQIESAPSLTYKKELCKMIASVLLSPRISHDRLLEIYKEIDAVDFITTPAQLLLDVEAGITSAEFASLNRGYPEGVVEKANEEKAERARIVAQAQAAVTAPENPGARGLADLSVDPKQDVQNDRNKNGPYKSRGNGKRPKKEEA
ncbi:MAG: hypothetical protein KGI50_06570 [Patescibacteria group bacterium]|nr:hypothetical protein [Patescibacteria group bacterium]